MEEEAGVRQDYGGNGTLITPWPLNTGKIDGRSD